LLNYYDPEEELNREQATQNQTGFPGIRYIYREPDERGSV